MGPRLARYKDKELANEFESGVEDNVNNISEADRIKGGGQNAEDFSEKPKFASNNLPLFIMLGAGALTTLYFVTKKK